MLRRFAAPTAILLIGAFAPPICAQSFRVDNQRFRLFNDCEPVGLLIGDLSGDATEIGLTRKRIRAAVESRLRSARLYDSDAVAYIYVNVSVYKTSFNISLQFKKTLHDPKTDLAGPASTWISGGTGTHGQTGGKYVISLLSEHMDEFLIEYLRVNEDACESR